MNFKAPQGFGILKVQQKEVSQVGKEKKRVSKLGQRRE